MNKQPEALRLADALEKWAKDYAPTEHWDAMGVEAAAELRRLHEVNQEWERVCEQHLRHIKKLKQKLTKATGESK